MSNAQDLGSIALGGNFAWGGVGNSVNFYEITAAAGGASGSLFQNYLGVNNSFQAQVANISVTNLFQGYQGFAAAFNPVTTGIANGGNALYDNLNILTWPKDQHIYYKLIGYNTGTQSYETWIITEEIVPRPETFDPTGNVPNIDYNVYFTPPSGHALVNIRIVGRWIQ